MEIPWNLVKEQMGMGVRSHWMHVLQRHNCRILRRYGPRASRLYSEPNRDGHHSLLRAIPLESDCHEEGWLGWSRQEPHHDG